MCTTPLETVRRPVEDSIKDSRRSCRSIKKSKLELYNEIVRLLKEAIFGIEV